MPESTLKIAPPRDLLYRATALYKNAENKELELLFSKFLKRSYDIDFWNLYIDYVKKISTKKVNLVDVYSFVCTHFEGSYFAYGFIKSYIEELEASDEFNIKVDQIRKVYHRSFLPMKNLEQLWSSYEKWELKVNRLNARTVLEQMQPTYLHGLNTYNRLSKFVEANDFFEIFDIELENPLKLSKKDLDARLNFHFGYYLNKYPSSEQLCFLYTFYMKDAARERLEMVTESAFLSIWYSFQYEGSYFNFEDKNNSDVIIINYLNWVAKNDGIEAMRQKFAEVKGRAGPHVFIYVASVEFYQGRSKEISYQAFTEGLERFRENPLLNEMFFKVFMGIGDDDNVRILFKKLRKTAQMWELMIEYEFLHGNVEDYKSLVLQRQKDQANGEVLPAAPVVAARTAASGSRGVYETIRSSFEYLDLQIYNFDILTDFIATLPPLPRNENVLLDLDTTKVVNLLASLIVQ